MGGWDERYAVVLAVATRDGVAAAMVDTNGYGADVDLDLYTREPGGEGVPGSRGNDGVGAKGWNCDVATASGWAKPGEVVFVEYMGQRYPVTTASSGCRLFVAPTADPDQLLRLANQRQGCNE